MSLLGLLTPKEAEQPGCLPFPPAPNSAGASATRSVARACFLAVLSSPIGRPHRSVPLPVSVPLPASVPMPMPESGSKRRLGSLATLTLRQRSRLRNGYANRLGQITYTVTNITTQTMPTKCQ